MILISMSEYAKKIEPKLREYYDDDDFVQGVVINAGSDKNLEIISEFINHAEQIGDAISSDNIAAMAVMLGLEEDE